VAEVNFETGKEFAIKMDKSDPLKKFRDQFLFPKQKDGREVLYFVGNSLGLQPKKAKTYVNEVLSDWENLGVEGHQAGKFPWYPYHEFLTESTARLVGAKPIEVVVMNTLTVNLHLMLTSFYRPDAKRFKIVIEAGAFPSDQYAVASQAKLHGYSPKEAILEWRPRTQESLLRFEDLEDLIQTEGESIALILLGNVNYRTGQAFPLKEVATLAQTKGIILGVDLAHGAGNLELHLHNDQVDFAVWCSYKYLNGGPGALGGCFVHEKHAREFDRPRLEGWWGHDKKNRFLMEPEFRPMEGAEGWQLSNPPILPMATLRASMELFDEAGMHNLRMKSKLLTGYFEFLIKQSHFSEVKILTPTNPKERGCALSLEFGKSGKSLMEKLNQEGIKCDYREPGVLRFAPVPLYNSFQDVFELCEILKKYVK
jgi:kynureninase